MLIERGRRSSLESAIGASPIRSSESFRGIAIGFVSGDWASLLARCGDMSEYAPLQAGVCEDRTAVPRQFGICAAGEFGTPEFGGPLASLGPVALSPLVDHRTEPDIPRSWSLLQNRSRSNP